MRSKRIGFRTRKGKRDVPVCKNMWAELINEDHNLIWAKHFGSNNFVGSLGGKAPSVG
jgi:hypothetical protein